jgi:peptidyl-Asp metalloendopeptidase
VCKALPRTLLTVSRVSICLLFVGWSLPRTLDAQSVPPLLMALPSDVTKKLDDQAKAAIKQSPVRTRTVKAVTHMALDSAGFQQLLSPHPGGAPAVLFNLPGTATLVFHVDTVRQEQDGRLIWNLEATNAPGVTALFIVNQAERSILGDIRLGGWIFQIRPAGPDAHSIYTVDASLFPVDHSRPKKGIQPISKAIEHPPLNAIPTAHEEFPLGSGLIRLISHGSGPLPILDLMVLYTPQAASAWPANGIFNEIEMARFNMVDSFMKAGIHADVHVVSIRSVSGFESGDLDSEVPQLRLNPQVKSWRDTDGADLVILWVQNAGPDCGATPDLAINSIPILPSRAADAFSIVDAACATGNFSFAHELGHQMGLFHDRVTAGAGADPYWNYGFVSPSYTWKTIMAWDPPGCPSNELGKPYCPRVNAWSDGGSRGVPIGTIGVSSTSFGPANNADALNKSIPVAANFRSRNITNQTPPSAPTNLKVN